jgi:hypothetical protein
MSKFNDACHRVAAVLCDNVAEAGLFLTRQLTSIKSKSYDKKYAALQARELFPVSHEHPPGTKVIAIPSYDRAGVVKLINDYATDLPRAEIKGKETLIKVNYYGNAYGYTKNDLMHAQMAGVPLEQRKANAAHMPHEENINSLAFFGDGLDVYGLFTYPGIPSASVPNGASTDPEWSTKTSDEILADMNAGVSNIITNTKMVERPNCMLLPVEQYELIRTTARSTTSDLTILEYFKRNNPDITVKPVNELAGAGTAGVDVMVTYRIDPDIVTLEIPMEITHNAPQQKGLEFEIPIESKCGGLAIYYPLAFNILEDI